MTIAPTLILLAAVASSASAADAPATPATLEASTFLTSSGAGWKLVWSDEFGGESLDKSKWEIGLPWGGTDGTGRHHNEQYASYILDHNIVVENGALKLLTRREDVVDKKGRTFKFTQGLVTTAKSFRHRYGYWEARVKLPVEAGPGLWPAFWTLAEGWPPEMDICEVWTGSNRSHQGLCYRPTDPSPTTSRRGASRERWDDFVTHTPLPLDWTTYGMEWGPGYQIYNINGKITKRVFGEHVTGDKHYILLNSGVESANPPTAATVFPNAFEVDYVRVYDRPDEPVLHNGGFEDDGQRPWSKSGQVVLVGYGANSGDHALRIDGGSSAEQKLFGLKPGTTYVVSAWIKLLSKDGEARLGVKNHGGDEKFVSSNASDYRQLDMVFQTGPEATTAVVYLSVPAKVDAALVDDISLRAK